MQLHVAVVNKRMIGPILGVIILLQVPLALPRT